MMALKWLAANGFFALVLWFGFVQGEQGAHNLAVGWIWLTFAVSLLCLGKPSIESLAKAGGPAVPRPIAVGFEFAVLGLLVWYGSWVMAVTFALRMLFMAVAWHEVGKLLKAQSDGAH